MCGRFQRKAPIEEVAAAFGADVEAASAAPPSYNIAPTNSVVSVLVDPQTTVRTAENLHWGLLPFFAKDRRFGYKTINARAETVDTMPSFRHAWKKGQRCLIAANGFYEWRTLGKLKRPIAFALKTEELFAFAGLWETWKDPQTGLWLRSCSIITTTANELVSAVHDRMPVILSPASYARWLGEEHASSDELKGLLKPFEAATMKAWPVSPRINKAGVGVDDPTVLALDPDALPWPAAPNSA